MKRSSVVVIAVIMLVGSGSWAAGYRTTVGEGADQIPLVVVSGTPHEMGLALGTLMKNEINAFTPRYLRPSRSGEASVTRMRRWIRRGSSSRST